MRQTLNKAVKRIKSIAFVLLYIAIYYSVSFIVYAIYYKRSLAEGESLSAIQELAKNNMYLMTVVIWVISMLCYALIGKLRKYPISTALKRNPSPPIMFAIVTAFAFGSRFLVSVYYSLSTNITVLDESIKMAESSLPDMATPSQLVLALLCSIVIAPYFEEILFRGMIMDELLKIMRPWIAIIIQAIAFGVMHGVLFQSIFAFVIGIALGFIYYRTKNIRIAVFFHCMFNFSAIFMQENLPPSGLMLYSVAGVILCGLSVSHICLNVKKDSWL